MDTFTYEPTTGYLSKAFNRAIWRALTPHARIEARREYHFMRRALGIKARPAHGIIDRLLAITTWER